MFKHPAKAQSPILRILSEISNLPPLSPLNLRFVQFWNAASPISKVSILFDKYLISVRLEHPLNAAVGIAF